MTTTPGLAALQAKLNSTNKMQANAKAAEEAVDSPDVRIFLGDLPEQISLMTPTGTPVFFYKGYHTTTDGAVIEFLATDKRITDVTGKIKLADVPVPPNRTRQGTWHASEAQTQISPAELLQRVVNSSQVPQASESNGT